MKFPNHFRVTIIASTVAVAVATGLPASAGDKKTIGLALTRWEIAMPGVEKEECPSGFAPSSLDMFRAQYPDENVRKSLGKFNENFGSPEHRGPNAQTSTFMPWIVEDPLPFPESQSKVAYGQNLDGTSDGRETGKSCKHQKFSSLDGSASDVDNELYRVTACWKGLRKGGFPSEAWSEHLVTNPKNRFLIEISDVDDELNDDHVEVTFYKGLDKITRDASGAPYPWLSQRVDRRDPDYTVHTTGKIINGELITDPMPKLVRPFIHSDHGSGELETLDMRMRLKLGATQADGVMTGYYDIWKWFFFMAKNAQRGVGAWSPPSVWASLVRHADGYKDPTTGRCTAISGTYHMQAVRSYILKDDKPAILAGDQSAETKTASKSR